MTEQLDIPWLEWARSHKDAFGERASRLFEEAIEFAESGLSQPAWYRTDRQSVNPDEVKCQAEKLTRKRHLVWRIALAEALSVVLPTGTDRRSIFRHLAQTLRVPPGLFLQDEKAHLSVQGNWIDTNVMPIINRWEEELDVRLLHKEADWPKAWNVAIVLEHLDRIIPEGSKELNSIVRGLVNVANPKYRSYFRRPPIPTKKEVVIDTSSPDSAGPYPSNATGLGTGVFRDASPVKPRNNEQMQGLRVSLCVSHWVAQLLQYGRFADISPDGRLYRHEFDLNRLSEHGNGQARVSTGLTVWDLYLSLAVEGLQQLRSGYVAPESFDMNANVPHDLPHQLADEVPPATWNMFSQLLVAGSSSAKSQQTGSAPLKLKTLFAPPSRRAELATDAMVQASLMGFLYPGLDAEPDCLGSICPNMGELDPENNVNWMEVVLAVQKSGQWGVVCPELIDDQEGTGRINLHASDSLTLAGLTAQELRQAIGKARWGVHMSGHGAFLCATLCLD
jgi:hypothetical protein